METQNKKFLNAQICLNGHLVNEDFDEYLPNDLIFCKMCGAKNIYRCLSCNSKIHGQKISDSIFTLSAYCYSCGKPYPWTEEKIKALNEAISLSEITDQEKEEFVKNIPDIVSENPRTKVAALKIKMIGAKVGKEIWSVTRDIFVDIASETAKKTMGI